MLERIGVIASLFLVSLAFLQFLEAHRERVKAQEALREAQEARTQAQIAATQAQETAKRIARAEEDLRQQVLSVTKMFYLQVVTRNEFGTKRRDKAVEAIEEELNAALRRALPDDRERARWIKEQNESMLPTRKDQKELSKKPDAQGN